MYKHLLFFLLLSISTLQAQTTAYNFESATIPSQISVSNSTVELNNYHLRNGKQALKWHTVQGAKLIIDMGAVCNYYRVIYLPIYSDSISGAKLTLNFYKDAAKSNRVYSSVMRLNYKGWREFHKFIPLDFSNSTITTGYRVLEITYQADNNQSNDIWFDDLNLAASYSSPYSIRIPGPQMIDDYQKGILSQKENLEYTYLDAYMRQPDIATEASLEEISDYPTVASAFKITNATINNGGSATSGAKAYLSTDKCTQAIEYVNSLNIRTNPDGSLTGTPFDRSLYITPSSLVNLSYQVLALSYGAQTDQNATAKEKLLLLTRYLLDQGIAAGGRVYVPTNSYTICRHFVLGFMHAMPIYQTEDQSLAQEVTELLRWAYTFGYVYGDYTPNLTSDFIYVKSRYLFALADLQPTENEKIRDVKSIVNYYQALVKPIDGCNDLIKPDGAGYHHSAMHNSYMYVFQNWIQDLYKLRKTCFRITQEGYDNASLFVANHFLQCATNGSESYYANSLCGRGPFVNGNKVGLNNWVRLIEMGGIIQGSDYEPEMASLYNYITGTKTFSNVQTRNKDGFYQMNYGNMGFMRKNNWVATMRGFTSQLWGTEIYSNANRYGRFQSYGALEILYNKNGILASSGYPQSSQPSWDWNVVPGTTNVHTSYEHLNPSADRADEIQKRDFAGALAFGQNGIFSMDFEEDPTNYWATSGNRYMASKLSFKKSYFVCDSIIVAIGSNITASPAYSGDFLATNLFQEITQAQTPATSYNQQELKEGTQYADLTQNDYTILTGCGTGLYLPKQKGTLTLFNGEQQTPLGNHTLSASPTYVSSNAVKGWIQHTSNNSSYEYVIIPSCTKEQLESGKKWLGSGNGIYTILQQNEEAHVVRFDQKNIYGYAVFIEYSANEGPIRYISAPSLVMAQQGNDSLKISVCDPTLNMQNNSKGAWVSKPFTINLIIDGIWLTEDESITCQTIEGQTHISVEVVQGMPKELILSKTLSHLEERKNPSESAFRFGKKLYLREYFQKINIYTLSGIQLLNANNIKAGSIIEIPETIILLEGVTQQGSIHQKL